MATHFLDIWCLIRARYQTFSFLSSSSFVVDTRPDSRFTVATMDQDCQKSELLGKYFTVEKYDILAYIRDSEMSETFR